MEPITAQLVAAGAGALLSALGAAIASGDDAKARQIREQIVAQYGPASVPALDRLQAEAQQGTAFNQANLSPDMREAQLRTLAALEREYEMGGMTEADRAAMQQAQNVGAGQLQSANASLQQNLAQHGRGGGYMGAMMQAGLAQDSANLAADIGQKSQIAARQRALAALEAGGQLASGVRGQDWQAARDRAQAQDAINRFNTEMRWNAGRFNAGQQQQEFENTLGVADRRARAMSDLAGDYSQGAQNTRNTWGGVGNTVVQAGSLPGGKKKPED